MAKNSIARTALYRRRAPNGDLQFGIVQDDGMSNVTVEPWLEGTPTGLMQQRHRHRNLAWAMGLEPQQVLVNFAGIGRDMVVFHALSEGKAGITGVELNPGVVN